MTYNKYKAAIIECIKRATNGMVKDETADICATLCIEIAEEDVKGTYEAAIHHPSMIVNGKKEFTPTSPTIEDMAAEYAVEFGDPASAKIHSRNYYDIAHEAFIAGATEADKRDMEFAEWCEANYFQKAKSVWVADIESGGEHYTTSDLLTIFKTGNERKRNENDR